MARGANYGAYGVDYVAHGVDYVAHGVDYVAHSADYGTLITIFQRCFTTGACVRVHKSPDEGSN